jgi:hypothetical protein
MIRIILINLFLLLLPFIIYFAYVYLVKGRDKNEPINFTPLIVLFGIGLILMMGAIAYFIQFEAGEPGQRYIPPRVEDGVLKPGRLE